MAFKGQFTYNYGLSDLQIKGYLIFCREIRGDKFATSNIYSPNTSIFVENGNIYDL